MMPSSLISHMELDMSDLQRVLHIEDDPSIQEIVRIALEIVGGFSVKSCASGAEGLKAAEAFDPQFILLDVMMPGMDGPQTLRHLREMPALDQVPIVFMTAKVQPPEVQEYQRMGAAQVITKPFDPMTLPDQVRTIWSQWHASR